MAQIIKRKFAWSYDDNRDCWGWRPMWNEWGEPGVGMTVAHDILEHRLRDDDSIEHELRAFGAMAYVRGRSSYWGFARPGTDYPKIAENTAYELARLVRRQREELGRAFLLPRRYPHTPIHDEAMLEDMVECAENRFDEEGLTEPMSPDERTAILAWLREGYRWAREFYRPFFPNDAEGLAHLFMQVEQLVEKHTDKVVKDDHGGVELHVQVDLFKRTVDAFRRYEDGFETRSVA